MAASTERHVEFTGPVQTTLMGLPTEVRLQIYLYLLDGTHMSDHPTATCHALWPAILVVSRQIFDEAMPILYNANKIHLQIEAGDVEECRRVEVALRSLPLYSFEHITDISLISKRPRWPSSRYWFDSSLGFTTVDWEYLREKVPNLKSLSIQLQVAKGDLNHIRWSVLEHLATLPKLKIVEIMVSSDKRFIVSTPELTTLTVKLMERLHRRAKILDKRMTVRALAASEGGWMAAIS